MTRTRTNITDSLRHTIDIIIRPSGVTIRLKRPEANIFRRPHSHKECQSYSYLSHLGTQATELTEAKESAYGHVRFSSHSDSGIT